MGFITLATRRPVVSVVALLALCVAFFAAPSQAAPAPIRGDLVEMFKQVKSSVSPTCGCEVKGDELDRFTSHLQEAESVEAAQALALEQSRLATRAVELASKLHPLADTVAPIRERLATYEAQVAAAGSQGEVAKAFKTLSSRGDDKMQEVKRKKGCDITGSELVIIIIGFILGILPGIIFLIVFC